MSRFAKKMQSQPTALAFQTQTVADAYLSLQRTQRALVAVLAVCAALGITVFRVQPGTLGNRTFLPIILSTSLLTLSYVVRNAMVLPALAELRRSPYNAQLLKRWSRNNLIVLALCGAVGLMGFAMQLLGAATSIALTLYAIAIGYLFLLRPIRP
jgi:hypothetical protein